MRNFIRKTFVAVILAGGASVALAQQLPPIPTDPNVRIGKLENGMTYYIRHNALPEKQADFYIAQKTTSGDWLTSCSICVSTERPTSRVIC